MTDRRLGRTRAGRARRDLRAIGILAPIRVAYELSRRAGLHELVIEMVAARKSDEAQVVRCPPTPDRTQIPTGARERSISEARRIANGTVRLFSRDIEVGESPDWHSVVETPGSWPVALSRMIDLRSDARPGDVKWVWELGRHRHLVVMARAAMLEPHEADWITTLSDQLRTFLDQNPPGVGVHWCSSLELAIRAFAWLEILALVGDRLDADLRTDLSRSLWRSGTQILADLPYSLSSMQNNHLLGEAAGLAALGRALDHPPWASIGSFLFDWQLAREIGADGSTIEESLSYQRFVMDIVARHILNGEGHRRRQAESPSRGALRRSAGYLARLGVLDGPVPQYGDWDEGRALAITGDPQDLAGAVHLGRLLGGDRAAIPEPVADEVAWYAPWALSPEPAARVPTVALVPHPKPEGRTIGGGFARARCHGIDAWMHAGATRWHAHADLCSIAVRVGDELIVGDPGTGSYNKSDEERQWFRSSRAHAVLELDGCEQVLPHRAFRWLDDPWSGVGAPVNIEDTTILWAAHAAYERPVARALLLEPGTVTIMDSINPAPGGPTDYVVRLPLGPTASSLDGGRVRMGSGAELDLAMPTGAAVEVCSSRWSTTYGETRRSVVVLGSGQTRGPIVTRMTMNDVSGRASRWHETAAGLQQGDSRLSFQWRGTVVALRLETPGSTIIRELRMTPTRRR